MVQDETTPEGSVCVSRSNVSDEVRKVRPSSLYNNNTMVDRGASGRSVRKGKDAMGEVRRIHQRDVMQQMQQQGGLPQNATEALGG